MVMVASDDATAFFNCVGDFRFAGVGRSRRPAHHCLTFDITGFYTVKTDVIQFYSVDILKG